ncbi:MAG: dynamin family protein [Bryobacteraceae bacterium]|nr:dynamin family protein [Bryobacteraceae bacterium]
MRRPDGLNESHRRRLLASAQYADKLLGEIEEILKSSDSKSPFLKYRPDITLHQARLIRSYAARFREHLARVLEAAGVERPGPQFSALHSVRVTLSFVRIAVQEMAPRYLRGYGALSEQMEAELRGLSAELEAVIAGLERNLALGEAADLQARLERLERTTREAELLRLLDRIVQEESLAEYRAPLLNLTERLESPSFEVAVFGRVSSGKSSLLNHILGAEVLPVGVNPITAVQTRLVYGEQPRLTVTFADRQVKECPAGDLEKYASEEMNPGNELGVTRLVVALPSPRLRDGLVFVDTPGLGALATEGAAETLSYLPQCDLGILLVSAASPINEEDLNTIQALSQAGIPVMGLLSKADLLSPPDRDKALKYTQREVLANLGLRLEIYPVSTVDAGEAMLEAWFRERLEPLLERSRELAQQSIRRKAGALAESVAAALQLKLAGSAPAPQEGLPAPIEEVEHRLRAAAGETETARRDCLAEVDALHRLGEPALERMESAVLRSWDEEGEPEEGYEALLSGAAAAVAREAAARISARLTALAESLQSALRAAQQVLPEQPPAAEEPLEQLVREMPRFEAAFGTVALSRPWFHGLRSIRRAWVRHKIRQAVGPAVQSAFGSYARALERWVSKTLAGIRQQFDAQAGICRAQLGRLAGGGALSPEQREKTEQRLRELAPYLPARQQDLQPAEGPRA